ncbi:MAG: helix-turn-helix domain-containing protein [Planctomycetota bacterium]
MASITQNVENQGFSLPLLENLDLHCFWARDYDQPTYGYRGHHFSDDTLCYFQRGAGWLARDRDGDRDGDGDGQARERWSAPCLFLFRKTVAYSAQAEGSIQATSMHFRAELAGRPPVSLLDLLDVPPLLPPALTATLAPMLTAMSAEYRGRRLGSQLMLEGHLRLLMAQFMRAWWTQAPREEPAARRGLTRLAPALAWMAEHIGAPVAVEAMAARVGLSAGHFRALFKQTLRSTPAQYLIQLRLERARRLLITSELTVNEVARTLGWSYPHYFIRQFKQGCGVTPAAWRAANAR